MTDHLLPGITATRLPTDRLTQNVLHLEGVDPRGPGEAVLFVHGNVSCALFWQQPMLALGSTGRHRVLAVDLRGYGDTDPLPVDATRGVRDWADDLDALVTALGLDRVHLVGWSMGAGVVLQHLVDRPERVASVALVAPVSPFGFGGTAGADGARVHPDGTGSGAGAANPDFVAALAAGDTGDASPTSPRNVLRSFYVAPGSLPIDPDLEDVFVAAMNSTRTGEDHYPGEAVVVEAWPGVAPGERGVLNTMAPTVFDASGIVDLAPKPPILWIRGRPTRSSRTPRCSTSPTSARSAPSRGGRGPRPSRPSRWSPRRARCSTGTPRPAAPTGRSCCPASATHRTSSARRSSSWRCSSTSTSPRRRRPT
ncbi:alpha/beta fold hydrolase [Blastococcus sp. PRF04-17]|uniref:alpha/beta fold hydrolase n=1 Tax=Blastococcus sp. PRF04-17 TaxID=2933797 RepID=UPI001FF16458|nr:alpha/beta fold hydrolase [Blastococcus sp. PRF04-17]UOY03818.1 alpha/beta fold hydrolase [Blastococcus sp. PRF04-17]